MLKKVIVLLLIFSLFIPMGVHAKGYTSLGLKEACEAEGISFNHPDYKESEEKANIYLFRGQGCTVCQEFLTYLNAMTSEYGEYFNLISFEVSNNVENNKLYEKVAKKFGDSSSGVPYIVIGNKSFAGYSEELNEQIFTLIQEEYKNKNKNDSVKKIIEDKDKFDMSDIYVTVGAVLVVLLFVFARSKTKEA